MAWAAAVAPGEVPVREARKDPWRQPYLPGSSMKGAVRTAVLWWVLSEDPALRQKARDRLLLRVWSLDLLKALDDMPGDERRFADRSAHLQALEQVFRQEVVQAVCSTLYEIFREFHKRPDQLERRDFERFAEWHWRKEQVEANAQYADDLIERLVLGSDPNHDLLRALQVRDSSPCRQEDLAVGLVWTYTLRNGRLVEKRADDGDYRAFLEWLPEGTGLRLEMHTDDFLFGRAADKVLHFSEAQKQAIGQLARTCNGYARSIIDAETAHFAQYGPESMHGFYIDLGRELSGLPAGAFLLNVGWGGGWEAKAVGELLRQVMGDDWPALASVMVLAGIRERVRSIGKPLSRRPGGWPMTGEPRDGRRAGFG